jgi:hypothetical protein
VIPGRCMGERQERMSGIELKAGRKQEDTVQMSKRKS